MVADDRQPTPERELLKIIETNDNDPRVAAKSSARKGLSLFSLGALKGRLSFLRVQALKVFGGGLALDISAVNRVLSIAAVALVIFLSFNFLNSMMGLKEQVDQAFKVDREIPRLPSQEVSVLKSPSFYLEKARKRDIFKMVSQAVKEKEKQEKEEKKEETKTVAKMTANLKLVGISWSDDPDAMIEDTKAGRTHFLKRGDTIAGVTVSGIFKDKVILNYEGEELELK